MNSSSILLVTTIETSATFADAPPDPNLNNPAAGSLAVVVSLAFAAGCGWWRKRQMIRHQLKRLKLIAALEKLLTKDS